MVNFLLPKKQLPLRSQQKKDLYKMLVARSDINAALSACDLILEKFKDFSDIKDRQYALFYSLTTAVIVCYSRPFTVNKPYGALSTRFCNPKYKSIHDQLIKSRHEMFAHSNMDVRKAQIVPPDFLIFRGRGEELKSAYISTQVSLYLFPVDFFVQVRKTILDLGSQLQGKIDLLIEELYSGMDLPRRPFTIRIDEGF